MQHRDATSSWKSALGFKWREGSMSLVGCKSQSVTLTRWPRVADWREWVSDPKEGSLNYCLPRHCHKNLLMDAKSNYYCFGDPHPESHHFQQPASTAWYCEHDILIFIITSWDVLTAETGTGQGFILGNILITKMCTYKASVHHFLGWWSWQAIKTKYMQCKNSCKIRQTEECCLES